MKRFFSLMLAFTAALNAFAFSDDIQKELDNLPQEDHLTITFYKDQNCKDGLDPTHTKSVVLTCDNDFGNNLDKYTLDQKGPNSTCVSGKFASYKISNQFGSIEKLAMIGVTKGKSQCNFVESDGIKTFKPSVTDYVSGGCHNLRAVPGLAKQCQIPLGMRDDTTYTYQCTRGWAKVHDKRFKTGKGKGPSWTIDGAMCSEHSAMKCHNSQLPDLNGRSVEEGQTDVLEKRFRKSKGMGPSWNIDGHQTPGSDFFFCDKEL